VAYWSSVGLSLSLLASSDDLVLGIYKGGSFNFTFAINSAFPHEPPKVSSVSSFRRAKC